MGVNENIIVQHLADIKNYLDERDIAKVYQECDLLKKHIDEYPVDSKLISRLIQIALIPEPSTSNLSLNDRIDEIDELIGLLTPK